MGPNTGTAEPLLERDQYNDKVLEGSLTVRVERRGGKYAWELHRDGRFYPVKFSAPVYLSEEAARAAGIEVRTKHLAQLARLATRESQVRPTSQLLCGTQTDMRPAINGTQLRTKSSSPRSLALSSTTSRRSSASVPCRQGRVTTPLVGGIRQHALGMLSPSKPQIEACLTPATSATL
jgi:hypothetical protein